jgi:hypothetical protein
MKMTHAWLCPPTLAEASPQFSVEKYTSMLELTQIPTQRNVHLRNSKEARHCE